MRCIKAAALILILVLGSIFTAYLVYCGYIQLNHPSHKKYPVVGVDLSHYQGEVDWTVLSKQDIEFAYIKATEGSSYIDSEFVYNWEQSGETDLRVGAYHFFSFDSSGEAQASNFIDCVDLRVGMLPPVIDVEYYADKKNAPPDPDEVREQLQIMLDKIEEHYRVTPVIYTTEEVWEKYIKDDFKDYPLWIRNVVRKPQIQADWTFWQYSNRGRLNGYSGEERFIDLNVFYGNKTEWDEWCTDAKKEAEP